MTTSASHFDQAMLAVTGAHSAVWHSIAAFRYMSEARDEGIPFDLTIFRDDIVTQPYAGLAVDWSFRVYPERLRERAQEVVRYTARQAIIEISDALRMYAIAIKRKTEYEQYPAVALLRAARNSYAHRRDDWDFSGTKLPLRWRQLDLVAGMHGKSVSETLFLNEQLLLMNDAIYLLDPESPLTATVYR